jgi:hypothetical protein
MHLDYPTGRTPALTPSREDDSKWPQKNKDGRQELEIRIGNEHISFEVIGRANLWNWPSSNTELYRLPRSARSSM